MDELADLAALSLSGLHRLFLRHLNMPVSEYLMRLRIGGATTLLIRLWKNPSPTSPKQSAIARSPINRQFRVRRP